MTAWWYVHLKDGRTVVASTSFGASAPQVIASAGCLPAEVAAVVSAGGRLDGSSRGR